MSDITNQDLKELILVMDKKFDQRFADMDKRMEVGFAEIRGEIKRVEITLKAIIECVNEKLIGIDKRLSNQEFIILGGIVTIFSGVVTIFVKQTFFT